MLSFSLFFNLEKKVTSPFVNVITDVTLNEKMTQRESKKQNLKDRYRTAYFN